MRRSGSGSPPAGRGGKRPAEVERLVIPGKKPVTTEIEHTVAAATPVAAELARAATSSEKPVPAAVEPAATNQKPVVAVVERAATQVEGAAAAAKPVAAEAGHAAAASKTVTPEMERATAGGRPAVTEGWERLARELWDPKVQSKFWLEVFSLATDAWLRSGAFLEFMQYGLQAAIGESSRERGSMNSGAEPFGEVGGTPRDPSASRKDKKL
jgi:hypothetical protein